MKVLVYGAGGVGGFFGGLLARAGEDVHFVARGAQFEALRRNGLRIRSALLGDIDVPRVSVFRSAVEAGGADVVLVCVKTHQTAAILGDLAAVVGAGTVVIPLQNGVDADEPLAARFGAARVIPAVVYVGATVEAPGVISHAAAGKIGLGVPPGGEAATLPAIQRLLARTGQTVYISNDIQRERWHKLMWNAAFNSVSATTLRGPADLLALPDTRALLLGIMREVLDVGRACGVDLRDEDIHGLIAWTERAAGLRTSTMVDRERGRPMEIDALVGVIVRKGRAAGIETPRSETVFALLKALDVSVV
jgi:2-dehydropantoate 2-reductase